MKLSSHFTLEELTVTEHRQFVASNRKLTKKQIKKLKILCRKFLEPIRKRWGPVIIHSGYRSSELNQAIGGSIHSQHCLCEAADFHVAGYESGEKLFQVFEWIHKKSGLKFGQLIYELASWIHISMGEPYRKKELCRQVLIYKNDKYERIQSSSSKLSH